MHVVMRRYTVPVRGTIDDIVRRASEGAVPLIRSVAGFVSYSLVTSGDQLLTVSIFQDRAGADESVRVAAGWVKDNLAMMLPNPPRVTGGEARVRAVNPDVPLRYGVMRRYRVSAGAVDEIVRRAGAEFVPIVQGIKGMSRYTVVDEGDGHITSLSGFDSQASADESTRVAGAWVRDNLAALLMDAPEVLAGEVRLAVVA